jgi:hypothetical protein
MPSLTLPDPDMILPYGGERESQTPSPPQIAYLSHLNSRNYDPNAPMAVGSRQKKNFSRSAWTHEDVNVSRRLSDIGEELSPSRSDNFDESGGAHESSSPSSQYEAESSSSSTVSAGSRRASEARSPHIDRDEAAAQAEVVKAQASLVGASPSLAASNSVASAAAEGKGPGEEFSSAILSSEAERILENAKKRLNVCGLLAIAIGLTPEENANMFRLIAYGRQSDPRSLDYAHDALTLALCAGKHPADGHAPPRGRTVSIDLPHRSQELFAAPAVAHFVAGFLE